MSSELLERFNAKQISLVGNQLSTELIGRVKRWQALRAKRLGIRGMLMYLLPLPLGVAAFLSLVQGKALEAMVAASALMALLFAARINRRAMLEHLLESHRQFSTQSRFRWQPVAMLLVGLGVVASAHQVVGHDLASSLLFSLLAMAGFHLAYRIKPLPVNITSQTAADNQVWQHLSQFEEQLINIERDALSIGNPEMSQRLKRIADKGRQVLNHLATHPDDLHRSRRFLHVYLDGAHRVASGYARSHRIHRIGVLENKFRQALVAIEKAFDKTLLDFDRQVIDDLDVEIAVLRQQLRQDGFI